MTPLTVAQLFELCRRFDQATLEGNGSAIIRGVNSLESASTDDVSFVAGRKAYAVASQSLAGCLIVAASFENASKRTVIRVSDPRTSFARLVAELYPPKKSTPGVHATAWVDPSANLRDGTSVGPQASIGARTAIGKQCQIGAGCSIGEDVVIGDNTTLHSNVSIYDRVSIGARVVIHSGCVVGSDGFGFAFVGDHYEKFPQIGTVEIGDDVELGANTCVDRAALGVTRIGDGVKVDNLVHIAHNCEIGSHVVIAAQTGFSGSVKIGDYAVIGGQVGVGDKARIESKAVVGSGAGILTSKIVHAGEPVWGTPARPLRDHLEQLANLKRLPQMRDELKSIEERLKGLERSGS